MRPRIIRAKWGIFAILPWDSPRSGLMVDDPDRKPAQISETSITATGLRLVKALVGNPPQSIRDLASVMGVTKTAIVAQLHELLAAGFVERFTQRAAGRGRPRHLFAATKAALLLLFASNQRIVVPAIWRAIEEIGGSPLSQEVLRRVSVALAEHYSRRLQGTTPAERLNEMSRLLCDEGMLVERQRRRPGTTRPAETELPVHRHVRPRPIGLLPGPANDEPSGRGVGPPDKLPARRGSLLHLRAGLKLGVRS